MVESQVGLLLIQVLISLNLRKLIFRGKFSIVLEEGLGVRFWTLVVMEEVVEEEVGDEVGD